MRRPIVWIALALLSAPFAAEEVRVYTNADLPAPVAVTADPRPLVEPDPAGWDFVIAFIERERARLEAQAAREADRRVEREPQIEERIFYLTERPYCYGYRCRDRRRPPQVPREREPERPGPSPETRARLDAIVERHTPPPRL